MRDETSCRDEELRHDVAGAVAKLARRIDVMAADIAALRETVAILSLDLEDLDAVRVSEIEDRIGIRRVAG